MGYNKGIDSKGLWITQNIIQMEISGNIITLLIDYLMELVMVSLFKYWKN